MKPAGLLILLLLPVFGYPRQASGDLVSISAHDFFEVSPGMSIVNDTGEEVTIYFYSYTRDFNSISLTCDSILLSTTYFPFTPFNHFLLYPKPMHIGEVAAVSAIADAPGPVYVTRHPYRLPEFIPALGKEREANYVELLFCGMVLMMALYMLGKYIQVHTSDYLFYTLHLFFTFFYLVAVLYESRAETWFPDPAARRYLHHVLQSLSHLCYFQFVRYFIRTRDYQPAFDKALNGISVIALIYLVADGMLVMVIQSTTYPELIVWTVMRILFLLFGVVSLAVWVSRSTHPLRNYLFIGTASMLGGGLLGLLFYYFPAWIAPLPSPLDYQIVYFRIGILIETLFFSLGLGYKQRLDEITKLQAEAQLQQEHARVVNLQELDTLKSRFLAGISHEFRTPLTLIMARAQDQLQRGADEVFTSIKHNSEILMNLVTQVLDLSRLDAGKLQLKPEAMSVGSVFKSNVEMFHSMAVQKGVELVLPHFHEDHLVKADVSVVEKVIRNLLSNAIKYTDAGGKVSVSCDVKPGQLHFTVSDTGIGIPRQFHERIFDRFFRVNEDIEGTGIGLALAKELVELHEGKIEITSEPGKGTTFQVFIAAEWISSKDNQLMSMRVPVTATPETVRHRVPEAVSEDAPVLLMIEDHDELRDYMASYFGKEYRVITAAQGRQGLEIAVEQIPDIVVTDWMMPVMSGDELCRELKTSAATSHIPVIILTAKADSASRLEGLETGADDYLTKPFDWRELEVRIKNLVQQRKRLQEKFAQAGPLHFSKVAVSAMDKKFLENIYSILEQHLDNSAFSIEIFAREAAVSRVQLNRKIKGLTGSTPSDLLRDYRLEKAAQLLNQKAGNVTEVAYRVGFENLSYFSKVYKQRFGHLPSEAVKG